MNQLKMLCLTAVAVAGLATFASSASATILTSPEGTAYTSTVKAESSNLSVDGSFVEVTCSEATVQATVESHGSSVTAEGKLSNLSFGGCNYSVTVLKMGSFRLHPGGTLTSTGAEVSAHTSVGTCIFTTNGTDVGTGTGTKTTGGKAVLDINSAAIPRTGGSFLCGSSGELTGNYTVTSPSTLFLD